MPQFFKTKQARRRDGLNDILDFDIDYDKGVKRHLKLFFARYYQAITIALLILSMIGVTAYYYNVLVRMRQNVMNLHSQIDSALQMRENIVPALTVVVYQFINHEKNMFLSAVDARKHSLSGSSQPEDGAESLKKLGNSLGLPPTLSRSSRC